MIPQVKIDMFPETTEDRLRRELAVTRAELATAVPAWRTGTPPAHADYLCWWPGCGYVRILRYHPGGWGPGLAPVTHWQLLPSPPDGKPRL